MPTKSRPRTGSLQFRPRKRAKKETPIFRSVKKSSGKTKAQSFLGYKAGMLHVFVKDERKNSVSFGQEISLPATIIECPPIKIFGVRGYTKKEDGFGIEARVEINSEKVDKHLPRKIRSFKKKHTKKEAGKENTVKKEVVSPKQWSDLEKIKEQLVEVRLLAHTQPGHTGFGKKKPEISEISINGNIEEQLAFAKEKLGQVISVKEVFERNQTVDVKAVTKGKGFQGVIKRHSVKKQGRKAKKIRVVGSISPWHPATVMWTVARPGQLGYHSRTEFNKRILEIGESGKKVSPASGFSNYGNVKNDFLIIAGSIPGPSKRCIALRAAIRNIRPNSKKFGEINFYSTEQEKKAKKEAEEEQKIEKVVLEKEKKASKKSVEEELAEASKKK